MVLILWVEVTLWSRKYYPTLVDVYVVDNMNNAVTVTLTFKHQNVIFGRTESLPSGTQQNQYTE